MKILSDKFFTVFFITISLMFSIGSLVNLFPRGVENEWQWSYEPMQISVYIFFPLIIALLISLCFYLASKDRIKTIFFPFAIILHFLFVISFCYLYPDKLTHFIATIFHIYTTGHFEASLYFPDIASIFTKNYTKLMPQLPVHSHTHLPGPVLCYKLMTELFKNNLSLSGFFFKLITGMGFNIQVLKKFVNPEIYYINTAFSMGILYLFALSSSLIPTYLLAKELFNRQIALFTVPLWIFVPATVSFSPQFDQVYPVISISAIYFFIKYLNSSKNLYMILSSLTLFIGIFFSFAFLLIIVFCGFLYLGYSIQHSLLNRENLKNHIYSLLLFLIPLAGLSLILYLVGHINIIEAYIVAMGVNKEIETHFTYFKWAFFFTWYDFFSFSGVINALFFIYFSILTIKRAFARNVETYTYLVISYALLLISIIFSGIVKGEVGRIFIFLMPILTIISAKGIYEITVEREAYRYLILFCAFLQVIIFKMTYCVMFDMRCLSH